VDVDRSARPAAPEAPALALGTATLGNLLREMGDEQAWAILEAAWEVGVRRFDTAPHYGLGLAERRLGEFLRTRPREELVVSTKVGRLLRPDPAWSGGLDDAEHYLVPARLHRVWDLSADGMRRSVEESLERMGLDRVDVAYLHDPERSGSSTAPEETAAALVRLREEGVADEVGVASMTTGTLADYARTGLLDVLMVAGRHTLLDQSAAAQVFPACRRHGTRVVAAAVFNSGLISDDEPGTGSLFDYEPAPAAIVDRTRRIASVCRELGVPLTTAALHFPLRDPLVTCVVTGAAEPGHVRANAEALTHEVPAALWERLAHEGLVTPP
jgi:D-threo-aldose 1-dehydrogenase